MVLLATCVGEKSYFLEFFLRQKKSSRDAVSMRPRPQRERVRDDLHIAQRHAAQSQGTHTERLWRGRHGM